MAAAAIIATGMGLASLLAYPASGATSPRPIPVTQDDANVLDAVPVYQGPQGSDAFSSIHNLGGGWIIAGKRSSSAANRFLLSQDRGATWTVVPCPGSTGAHTYFFGQHGTTVLSGTGDTGNACILRSTDGGLTWSVGLAAPQLRALIGSADAKAVFGLVHVGGGQWLANVKSLDAPVKIISSQDDGLTWAPMAAQPGQAPSAWARQMIYTSDGILLWPSVLTDKMYRSLDKGTSWSMETVPGARLFQPLCDAGQGVYLCGEVTTSAASPIHLFRSGDRGQTWRKVASVNLQRPTTTYWRDVTRSGNALFASACCQEGTANQREMQLFKSTDTGKNWISLGNPYSGPYGGMQAIYQMCATSSGEVFAACQPDSTIIRWIAP